MIWQVLTVLLSLTITAFLYALYRKRPPSKARIDYDITVYRSQLAKIERDLKDGLLPPEQAEAAKTEIHRRMLAADDQSLEKPSVFRLPDSPRLMLFTASLIVLFLAAGSLLTYALLGTPELPGGSSALREKKAPDSPEAEEARLLAAQLQREPSEEGYAELGSLYLTAKLYDKAADAYHRAIVLNGKDAGAWSGLGEALVKQNEGAVVRETLSDFLKALELDAKEPAARFYIGLAETQIGNLKKAAAIWRDLEKDSSAEAPWRATLQQQIAAIGKDGGFEPGSIRPEPPDLDALKMAASAMDSAPAQMPGGLQPPSSSALSGPQQTPEEKPTEMIVQMVARLAARMKENPTDADGWYRLAKSYQVLGEKEKALDAIRHALALKPGDENFQSLQNGIRQSSR